MIKKDDRSGKDCFNFNRLRHRDYLVHSLLLVPCYVCPPITKTSSSQDGKCPPIP